MQDFLQRLTSRKFLLAVASVLFALVQLGAGAITADQAADVIKTVVLGYLAAEGVADTAGRLKSG